MTCDLYPYYILLYPIVALSTMGTRPEVVRQIHHSRGLGTPQCFFWWDNIDEHEEKHQSTAGSSWSMLVHVSSFFWSLFHFTSLYSESMQLGLFWTTITLKAWIQIGPQCLEDKHECAHTHWHSNSWRLHISANYCNLVIEATIFDQIEHIFDSCLTSFGPLVFHDAMMMRCSWINVLPSKSNGLGRQLITFPGMRHSWPICWSFPVEPGVELFLGLPYDVAETNFIDTDTS